MNVYTHKCVLIGYSLQHEGYKFLSQSSRVFILASVAFNKTDFPFKDYSILFSIRLVKALFSCVNEDPLNNFFNPEMTSVSSNGINSSSNFLKFNITSFNYDKT